jgi:hypothetical protein
MRPSEVLLEALTRLASYEGRSAFRTWLYRIAVNHGLNTRRSRREQPALTFACYAHGLDATPDLDLPDASTVPADVQLLVDEARIGCTSGMLLCLDREQRLVYVLGEIFGVTDAVGAELPPPRELPPAARPRSPGPAQLHERQVRPGERGQPVPVRPEDAGFIDAGYVDPDNLLFAREHIRRVRDAAPLAQAGVRTLDRQYAEVFRDHPFQAPTDPVPALRRLLQVPGGNEAGGQSSARSAS